MRHVVRWWETLDRPERIVAMSLATGGVVAIVNSAVWALAVSYMARQKTLMALSRERLPEAERETDEWPDALRAGTRRGIGGRG
ncbi:MAG TPA: hypothetical protein VJQ45_11825 [Ktedonobacterales bacterium]|nr:hypothetical protein [Ktedonobacterales bacterium]